MTVTATANPGYAFVNWTEGGVPVSATASYLFPAGADRTLVANFTPVTAGGVIRELEVPAALKGGTSGLGEVELATRAPAGGLVVRLVSSNPAILSVPRTVLIPEGRRAAVFRIRSSPVSTTQTVDVTASAGTSQKVAQVKVLRSRRDADRD